MGGKQDNMAVGPPLDKKAKPEDVSRLKIATKNIILPFGMFLYAFGLQMGTLTIHQWMYHYVTVTNAPENSSLSLNIDKSSQSHCNKNHLDSRQKQNQEESADWLMYFEILEFGLGLPMIVLAGIYSDFYGRKKFLLINSAGAFAYLLVASLTVLFHLHINYMYIAYAIIGITGTRYTFFLATTALVADTTEPGKSRSFHMMIIHTYVGLGFMSASLVSGFLIHAKGYGTPLGTSSGSCFLGTILLCFVKETLTEKIRSERPPFLRTFLRSFGLFFGKGYTYGSRRWKFVITFVSFLVLLSASTAVTSTVTLYELGQPFCFTSRLIGYFNAAIVFGHLVIGAAILKLLHQCLHDEAVTMIGILSGAAYLSMVAVSTTTWMLFVGAGLGVLATVPLSLYRGIISSMTSETYQGALFSVIYFFEALARLSASALFLSIYGHTQSFMKGFVFLVMAGFYLMSGVIFSPVAVSNRNRRKYASFKEVEINAAI